MTFDYNFPSLISKAQYFGNAGFQSRYFGIETIKENCLDKQIVARDYILREEANKIAQDGLNELREEIIKLINSSGLIHIDKVKTAFREFVDDERLQILFNGYPNFGWNDDFMNDCLRQQINIVLKKRENELLGDGK